MFLKAHPGRCRVGKAGDLGFCYHKDMRLYRFCGVGEPYHNHFHILSASSVSVLADR